MDTRRTARRRPRIGISAWLRALPTFLGEQTYLYTLGCEYVDAVSLAGGLPLILPRAATVDTVLDTIDGLLLSGGDDIHPASYGDPYIEASLGVDREADEWEIELVRGAARHGMPTLGICRGMQIMSVAFGGRLVQDMAGLEGHRDIHHMPPDDILAERHAVRFDGACTLATIYGASTREVNTIHHQAVVDAGQLTVTGYGPAGVIEAVEPAWDWPAIGVQWHPEKLDDPAERQLLEYLVRSAREFAASKDDKRPATPAHEEHS